MKPLATRSVRLAVFGLLALATAVLGLLWWGDVSVALADSASGKGDGIRLSVKNGRVIFSSCNGKCKVSDMDPISAGPGPLRAWQKDFILTHRGLKTTFETPKGDFISYLGRPATICFRFTAAEASAAGGRNFLRVAYWDKRLKDCDANGCTTGRWYVLYTTYTQNNEACALLRRTSTFALVILSKNVSAAATQFSNVSTPLAPTSVPNPNSNSGSNPPAATPTPNVPAPTDTPKPAKVPPTDTLVPTSTFTPVPSATYTWTPSRTATRPPTNTRTRIPTSTPTFTPVPPTATNTLASTATNTPAPTATDTPAPTHTDTPVPTHTDTPVPTNTDTPVPTIPP